MNLSSTRAATTGPFERLRHWLGGSYAPYFYIAPFFIIFLSFSFYPLAYAFRLSFTSWHGAGDPKFIGLENYTYLLHNEYFWNSLKNSASLWTYIVPLQTIMAIFIASLLSGPLKARGFFRVIFLIPYLVPLVAIAQVWLILFDSDFGAVNTVLGALGIPTVGWLTTGNWAKPTMALLVFWKNSGFAILVMLAAIQNISMDVYEAAALDGANGVQKFFLITVPLLRQSIAFYVIIATLGVLQMYAEPYVLTEGGPYNSTTTAGYALYRYTRTLDLGTGAANSFLLMILGVILSAVMLLLLRTPDAKDA